MPQPSCLLREATWSPLLAYAHDWVCLRSQKKQGDVRFGACFCGCRIGDSRDLSQALAGVPGVGAVCITREDCGLEHDCKASLNSSCAEAHQEFFLMGEATARAFSCL